MGEKPTRVAGTLSRRLARRLPPIVMAIAAVVLLVRPMARLLIPTKNGPPSPQTPQRVANAASKKPQRPGIDWQEVKGNPVISQGACPGWRCTGAGDPALLRQSDNSYLIWFTTMGVRWSFTGFKADGPWLGRASVKLEADHSSAEVLPESPVIGVGAQGVWDRYVETPAIFRDPQSQQLTMWYLGYRERSGPIGFLDPAIGQMTAPDSQGEWQHPAAPIYRPTPGAWDSMLVTGPTVVCGPDGIWRLYYTGLGAKRGVGLLTSSDRVHWLPHPGNPILEAQPGAWDDQMIEQSVLYLDGQYWMWYSGFRGSLRADTLMAIGLATSSDGVHWTRYSDNPVLRPCAEGTWCDLGLLAPDVVVAPDGSLLMAAYGNSRKNLGKTQAAIGLWRSTR